VKVPFRRQSLIDVFGQEEDVDEFYNGSGITWKLSAQEARAVAGLKV